MRRRTATRPRLYLTLAAVTCAAVALVGPASGASATATADSSAFPSSRNAIKWPFAQNSIWNMPIGSSADYRYARLDEPTAAGPTSDEDIIIMRPDAPKVDVLAHNAGWDGSRKRCESVESPARVLIDDAPIPNDFVTDPHYTGITPNASAAILMGNGRTIKQSQPFHRCSWGGLAVTQFVFPDDDIYTGNGIQGAHGGAGMSSLGGTIRAGELTPGSVIRHALKLNLWGKTSLYCNAGESDGRPGYRWPAVKTDTGACDPGSFNSYNGSEPGVQMGTLLALKSDFNVGSLRTEAARIMAQALKDYGAYVVDNTGWDVVGFETEWGPDGRVKDEIQRTHDIFLDSSHDLPPNQATADFQADVKQMLASMHYIANNGPSSIGGGGTPRQPLAPPFG